MNYKRLGAILKDIPIVTNLGKFVFDYDENNYILKIDVVK